MFPRFALILPTFFSFSTITLVYPMQNNGTHTFSSLCSQSLFFIERHRTCKRKVSQFDERVNHRFEKARVCWRGWTCVERTSCWICFFAHHKISRDIGFASFKKKRKESSSNDFFFFFGSNKKSSFSSTTTHFPSIRNTMLISPSTLSRKRVI